MCHTYRETDRNDANVRIVGVRKATQQEIGTYKRQLAMKDNSDFSKGVRGKFYRKGATLRSPIYLEAQLQARLVRIAKEQGRELGDVVNDLLAKQIATPEGSH